MNKLELSAEMVAKYKKYQLYFTNLEWHIKTNKPTGVELSLCVSKMAVCKEMIRDLKELENCLKEGLGRLEEENMRLKKEVEGKVDYSKLKWQPVAGGATMFTTTATLPVAGTKTGKIMMGEAGDYYMISREEFKKLLELTGMSINKDNK